MADFSLSFDSDNPFAEPETAPKSAPAAGKADALAADPVLDPATSPADSVAENADTSEEDAFSLSAFDFAFDEGGSSNDNLPTQKKAVEDAPRFQTPGEAAFAEFDFGAPETEPDISLIEIQPVEEEDFLAESAFDAPALDVDEVTESSSANVGIVAPEIAAPEVAVSGHPDKSAPSDLDEFNALALEFGGSDEETIAEDDASDGAGETEFDDATAEMFAPQSDEIFAGDLNEAPGIAEPELAVAGSETEMVAPPVVDASAEIASELESGIEARPHRTKALLTVAILGASGIGKNHARWFHRNGCRISAFLGTSGDSTAKTEADLAQSFSFEGKAYTDLTELLATEKPDIVCVATPPELHFAHVLQSLEAGAHVLCEKPLVYAPTRKFRENRDGAKELVKVAAKRKLVLGTQLQYGAATPILCKLAGLTPSDVGDFAMELETLNPNAPLDPRGLWIDLGPHPISIAQMLAGPGAKLDEETIRFEPFQNDDKTEVLARFGINCADGRLLMSRVVVRVLRDGQSQPRRRFSFNGHSVSYAPIHNRKDNFQAQFIAPDGYSSVYADPVDYLISDFVRACREGSTPLISGDFGRENLEWMLKVAGEK